MIKRLKAERARVTGQQRAMLDAAEAEKRDLTSEEDTTFKAMSADTDAMTNRIAELETVMARNQSADAQRAKYEDALNNFGVARGLGAPNNMNMNPSDSDLREWMLGRGDERHLVVNLPQTRDLSVGTPTAGSTVPEGFANQLHSHMIETAAIRQTNVTVLRTQSGGDINVPTTTAHGTAALVAEGVAVSEADPTFTAVTLQAFKYGVMIQVSSELINDSGVDLVGYLARQAGRAIGNASGKDFITGDGSAKPNGVLSTSILGVTGGTGQSGAPPPMS